VHSKTVAAPNSLGESRELFARNFIDQIRL
jgi:hypothetical protein